MLKLKEKEGLIRAFCREKQILRFSTYRSAKEFQKTFFYYFPSNFKLDLRFYHYFH